MFPVPSKITAVHYCPLPARGDPHPPPAMDLPRLTNPPHLRHPLFAEGGSTWISWSSNYLPDTNPLKKAAHNGRLRLRCFAKLFYCPQNIAPRRSQLFHSRGCSSWICFNVGPWCNKLFHDLSRTATRLFICSNWTFVRDKKMKGAFWLLLTMRFSFLNKQLSGVEGFRVQFGCIYPVINLTSFGLKLFNSCNCKLANILSV